MILVMVPQLLICKSAEVIVAVPVEDMVKALGIPGAHHGHKWRLVHFRLFYELIMEDICGMILLQAH